jgi:DNA-binding transcriptional MerR regulator
MPVFSPGLSAKIPGDIILTIGGRDVTGRYSGKKGSSGTEAGAKPADRGERNLTIGQLAARVNLNTSTIRYYEELGLVSSHRKDSSNHRRYGVHAVITLNLINRAKFLGMSLEEIKELISLFGVDPIHESGMLRALEILEEHSLEIDKKVRELKALKKSIKQEQNRLRRVLAESARGDS